MKNLFFYLAPALLTATIATAATTCADGTNTNHLIATTIKSDQFQASLAQDLSNGDRTFSPVEDKTVLNPENVIAHSEQSIEEIIAENNKITESVVTYDGSLLFIEKSTEQTITDDNKIIESNISAEIYPLLLERTIEDVIEENNHIIDNAAIEAQPLDFDRIGKKPISKQENKLLIGMN